MRKFMTALTLACVFAAACASAQTLTEKRRYLHDLRGVSCSIAHSVKSPSLSRKPGSGGGIAVPPAALLDVVGGVVDKSGISWAKVKSTKDARRSGWIRLDALSCI